MSLKTILLLVLLVGILLIGSTQVYADNVTSVNITMAGTLTYDGTELEEAMTNSGNAVANTLNTNFTELVMTLVVMLALAALAYMRNDRPLFLVSGLGFITYGFSYFATSLYFSILMVVAGVFLFIRAFTKRGEV